MGLNSSAAGSICMPVRPPQLLPALAANLPTAPPRTTLRRVTSADGPEMARLRTLFGRLFPQRPADNALLPLYTDTLITPNTPLLNYAWLVEVAGVPAALRLFTYLPRYGFGHGAFIGVAPEARHLGLARWLVRCTLAQLAADAQALSQPLPWGYCAEVERPEDARSPAGVASRMRRMRFHLTSGASRLPVAYEEPTLPLGGSLVDGQPMDLLWYPLRCATLHPDQLRAMVGALYDDIYRLPPDAPLVLRVLRTLPL